VKRSSGTRSEKPSHGGDTRGVSGFTAAENDVRHLATIMPNGTPQVTPAWFDYTNGKILINSAKGRVKARNIQEGPPVALSILDPDNPYRYIQIRGRVEHVTEEGAPAHIDSLAEKYLGKDRYPWAQPGQVRITFEIEPTAVQAQG
jgi:PPOX class probable F420-dependent enzyme